MIHADEEGNVLGSAAAGAAAAKDGAGGHSTGKAKRRASSARRLTEKPLSRSRSPDRGAPADTRAEMAERAMVAPLYVEPGADGDNLGAEGFHRNNMEKLCN